MTAQVAHLFPQSASTLYPTSQTFIGATDANKKNFAIDYDETFTLNPEMWLKVAELFHAYGINVYVVTYRYDINTESFDLEYLKHYDFIKGIVFTGRKGKDAFCKSLGIHIDVWIDDNPVTITHSMVGISPADLSYSFTPDNMGVVLTMPPRHEAQAQYEGEIHSDTDGVIKH